MKKVNAVSDKDSALGGRRTPKAKLVVGATADRPHASSKTSMTSKNKGSFAGSRGRKQSQQPYPGTDETQRLPVPQKSGKMSGVESASKRERRRRPPGPSDDPAQQQNARKPSGGGGGKGSFIEQSRRTGPPVKGRTPRPGSGGGKGSLIGNNRRPARSRQPRPGGEDACPAISPLPQNDATMYNRAPAFDGNTDVEPPDDARAARNAERHNRRAQQQDGRVPAKSPMPPTQRQQLPGAKSTPRSPKCVPAVSPLFPPREQQQKATATDQAMAAGFFGAAPPETPTPLTGTPMGKRVTALIFGKGVRGIREEYYAIKAILPQNLTQEHFKNNMDKNRYKDVICADQTRVTLDGPGGDYIHASWVNGYSPEEARKFICTQGPTQETCRDFWRMVHQYQCVAIVMLCQVVEKNKPKCEPYYPTDLGGEKRFGDMVVRNRGIRLVDVEAKQGRGQNETLLYSELQVEAENSGKAPHTVGHWQWCNWPDKGVPDSSDVVFHLLDLLDPAASRMPIVVHCSAGIGRTGTLVFLDICRSYLEARAKRDESATTNEDEVDFIRENVLSVRRQRMLSIQTELQYVFVHRAIIDVCITQGWLDCNSTDCVNFMLACDLLFTRRKPT